MRGCIIRHFPLASGLSFQTGEMLAAVDARGGTAVSLPYPTGATSRGRVCH
jgi:hypothetical protein